MPVFPSRVFAVSRTSLRCTTTSWWISSPSRDRSLNRGNCWKKRDTEFVNLATLLYDDGTIHFNFAILTGDSCTALFFPCPSKDPSISRRTLHKRIAGNISGIYFRVVPRTTACRRMDGSLANHLRVDFWNGNRKNRLYKIIKIPEIAIRSQYLRISACCLLACSSLMSKSCGLLRDELTLFIPPISPFSIRCSYVCLSLIDPLRTLLLIDLFSSYANKKHKINKWENIK